MSDAINNSSTGLIKRVTDLENAGGGGDLLTKSVNVSLGASGSGYIYLKSNVARITAYGNGSITITKIVTPVVSLYSYLLYFESAVSAAEGSYYIQKSTGGEYYHSSTISTYVNGYEEGPSEDRASIQAQTITTPITLTNGQYLQLRCDIHGDTEDYTTGNSISFGGPFSVTYVKTDGMAIEVTLL